MMVRKMKFALLVMIFLVGVGGCSTFVPVPVELTHQAEETIQVETEIAGKVYQAMTLEAFETLIVKLSETPIPPTETMTLSPTPLPTSTDTPEPTATDTPEPTATDTPEPTATDTPEPTATDTPEPTATDTPEPTATDTPEPTATDTPEPTATDTPEPTATDTPEPTATNTPEPTATDTPEPTATNTPEPTATDTPEPTETDTPAPTVAVTNPTHRQPVATVQESEPILPPAIPTADVMPGFAAETTKEPLPEADRTVPVILIEPSPVSTLRWEPDFDGAVEATVPAEIAFEALPTLSRPSEEKLSLTEETLLIPAAETADVYRVETEADEMILIRALNAPVLKLSEAEGQDGEPALIYLNETTALIQPHASGMLELSDESDGDLEIVRLEVVRLDEETPRLEMLVDSGFHAYRLEIPVGDGVRFEVDFDEESGGEVSFFPWTGDRPQRYAGISRVEWSSCCGLSEVYFVLIEPMDAPAIVKVNWISRDSLELN